MVNRLRNTQIQYLRLSMYSILINNLYKIIFMYYTFPTVLYFQDSKSNHNYVKWMTIIGISQSKYECGTLYKHSYSVISLLRYYRIDQLNHRIVLIFNLCIVDAAQNLTTPLIIKSCFDELTLSIFERFYYTQKTSSKIGEVKFIRDFLQ